jgi:hypothetical protein
MSEPAAGVETDQRRGDAWFRTHFDGRLLADLRWLGNQYRILVFRLPERAAVADACCIDEPRLARLRADRIVNESYPHDCSAEECAPWVQYTQA